MDSNTQFSSLFVPGDTICQWIYNKPKKNKKGEINTNRKRVGYIVAGKDDDGTIFFGWSKCASHDMFDMQLAREIAYGRLMAGTHTPFPGAFKAFMPEFILRSKKYFQSDVTQDIEFFTN